MLVEAKPAVLSEQARLQNSTIGDLPRLLEYWSRFDPERKRVFDQLFEVEEISPAINTRHPDFGQVAQRNNLSPEDIESAKIIQVRNKVLGEVSVYNLLRAKRKLLGQPEKAPQKTPKEDKDSCVLCNHLTHTPESLWGRVQVGNCTTATNLYAFDLYHDLVFPKIHDPSNITSHMLEEMSETSLGLAEKVFKKDPEARFWTIGWNKLARAGSSIFHPHWQVTFSKKPEPSVEELRDRLFHHKIWTGARFEDNLTFALRDYLVHQVGETRLVFNLAPKKDNEAIIFTRRLNRDFTDALAYLFDFWQSELGVTSWNMVIFCPPIAIAKEEKAQWGHFPWMARIVDRGSEGSVVSDIGYKELYGLASIVSHDPFEISRAFARYLSSS